MVIGVEKYMTAINRQQICEGVHFSSVPDSRFKTGRITAAFLLPLTGETAAANAILPYLLCRSCREYPDFTALNRKLSELYGAALYADVHKVGEVQMLCLSAVGIDDRYALDNQSVSRELTSLLCSVLFDPALENGVFRSEDIKQEKRQLIERIDAEYNDKRSYAKMRCEELMCQEEAFGVSVYGKREQVEQLTAQEIVDAWRRALRCARIELIMLGNSDPKQAKEVFSQAFSRIEREQPAKCSTEVVRSADEVHEYNDSMDVAQAKLVIGFRAGTASPDEDVMATRLMTALYGGTPHSKLFLNVREKMSLCYYCSSQYDRYKGIIMVGSGVEQQNIEKARKEILHQLEEVQNGNFDDNDLESAKMSVANSFRSVADYLGGLEYWYLCQTLEGAMCTPEQSAENITKVTRQQVIDAAKKVTLDTVYTLTGQEEEQA
jgi:predicted Zn-dependent peptidase